jgi:hypothetical protein
MTRSSVLKMSVALTVLITAMSTSVLAQNFNGGEQTVPASSKTETTTGAVISTLPVFSTPSVFQSGTSTPASAGSNATPTQVTAEETSASLPIAVSGVPLPPIRHIRNSVLADATPVDARQTRPHRSRTVAVRRVVAAARPVPVNRGRQPATIRVASATELRPLAPGRTCDTMVCPRYLLTGVGF